MTPRLISKIVAGFLTDPKTNQASKAGRARSVLQSLEPGQIEKLDAQTRINLKFWSHLATHKEPK